MKLSGEKREKCRNRYIIFVSYKLINKNNIFISRKLFSQNLKTKPYKFQILSRQYLGRNKIVFRILLMIFRYWSHVVNCSSCNAAYKALNIAEVALQVISIAAIGAVALTKQGVISAAAKATIVTIAILCFAASKWLSHFVHKTFHFQDYNHALV